MAIGTIDTPPEYQGCFQEDPSKPDLSGEPPLTVSGPEACLLHCSIGTWAFAGIRNGSVCTCGDEKGHYGLAISPAECSTACPPNTIVGGGLVEWCGGPSVNSVYKVGNYSAKVPPGSTSTGGGGTIGPTTLPTHPEGDGDKDKPSSGSGGRGGVSHSSAVVIGSIVGSVAVLACGVLLLVMMRRRRARSRAGFLLDSDGQRGGGDSPWSLNGNILSNDNKGNHNGCGGGTGFVSEKSLSASYPYHATLTNNNARHHNNNNSNNNSANNNPASFASKGGANGHAANAAVLALSSPLSAGGGMTSSKQQRERRSSVVNLILRETVRGGAFDSDVDDGGAIDPAVSTASVTPAVTTALAGSGTETGVVLSSPRSPTVTSPTSPTPVDDLMVMTGAPGPQATSLPTHHQANHHPVTHRRASRHKNRPSATVLKGTHGATHPGGGRGGLRVETGNGKLGGLSPLNGQPSSASPVSSVSPVSPVSPISPVSKNNQGCATSADPSPGTATTPPHSIPPSPTTPSATAAAPAAPAGGLIIQAAPNHAAARPQQRSPQLQSSASRSARRRSASYLTTQDSVPMSLSSPSTAATTPAVTVGLPTTRLKHSHHGRHHSQDDDDLDGLEWSLPYSRPYYPPASPYTSTAASQKTRSTTSDSNAQHIPVHKHDDRVDGHGHDDSEDVVVINSPRKTSVHWFDSEEAQHVQDGNGSKTVATHSIYPRAPSSPLSVVIAKTTPSAAAAIGTSPPSPLHLSPTSHLRPPEPIHRRSSHASTTMLSSSPPPPRILIHEAE
ncbi:hypothetical protein BGZ73_005143 [Actinomortierella ambigua]|nr:hypothetical protein BGZ73_005143 [Actinomortierella ambigua]